MAVVRLCVAGISRADARMRAVVVGCPRAVIMSERIAILKGFRALFAADSAGLVIDRFCYAGRGGFQVFVFCCFGCEVVRQKIAVFRLAVLADCFLRAGSRAAVMGGSFCFCLAAGVDFPMVFTVMLPVAQYAGVVIRVLFAIFKGFRSLFAADGAGLVIDCFCCAGRGRFQILVVCFFGRGVML